MEEGYLRKKIIIDNSYAEKFTRTDLGWIKELRMELTLA